MEMELYTKFLDMEKKVNASGYSVLTLKQESW